MSIPTRGFRHGPQGKFLTLNINKPHETRSPRFVGAPDGGNVCRRRAANLIYQKYACAAVRCPRPQTPQAVDGADPPQGARALCPPEVPRSPAGLFTARKGTDHFSVAPASEPALKHLANTGQPTCDSGGRPRHTPLPPSLTATDPQIGC